MTEQGYGHSSQIKGSKEFDPLAFLCRAGAGKTLERYRKNQKIFSQGEDADAVCFIRNGKVKITVLSDQGKEAVIGLLTEGQFFGEGCLNGVKLRSATSHAVEDCLITCITKAAMLGPSPKSRSSRRFSWPICCPETAGSKTTYQPAVQFQRKTPRTPAPATGEFREGKRNSAIPVTLSQETLAEMIGTTRSRVSYFMNNFRKKGLISYNGQIEVHSSLLDAVLRISLKYERLSRSTAPRVERVNDFES